MQLEIIIKKSDQGYYLYMPERETYLYAYYTGIIKPELVIKESETKLVIRGTVYFTIEEARFIGKEYFKRLGGKSKIESPEPLL